MSRFDPTTPTGCSAGVEGTRVGTIRGMKVPPVVTKVSVDAQGRMVLPKWLRRELGADPGELAIHRTPEGVLLTPLTPVGEVGEAPDGAPVLRLGRPVSNEEVLAAIDEERSQR